MAHEVDFSFVKCPITRLSLEKTYNMVLLNKNIYEAIMNKDINDPWYLTQDPKLENIYKFLDEDVISYQSGSSYALLMRAIESILKKGYPEWRRNFESL